MSWSTIGELDFPLAKPRDGNCIAFESSFAKNRIVASTIERDGQAVVLNRHSAGSFNKPTVQLLRSCLFEAIEARRQPTVTTVGNHGQCGIEVDVQSHFAG